MYKNALKEDLIRVVEDLDGTVESTDTIAKLKTKIEKSSTFESDPDFVKTLIKNCIDERVSQNEREATLEKQKIELAKLQLAQLEKEIELQTAKNEALSLNPAAKRFKPKESNDHIHNRKNVNTLKVESEKQNSDEFANLQYVSIFVENQPVTALIDSGCQIPVLNSSLIRVQKPSEEIITLSSCFGEQRMVEVKPINLSLNQHSPGLSVRTAISPTLTEEFIIHPSVYAEIKKLGHAKSDVLLNESESSLGAVSFSNVSVSSVIKNSSYDLPHVKNFNTRNDLSSLIKDYKCNKIKSTKLKLSIVREKCSDIVLCKKVNGAMKTSSVEFISRSPTPSPMKSKQRRFAMLRRIFQPWQWKRRKKRDRFEQTSRTLERKISMRSTKELIKKGVLMPDGTDKDQDSKINDSVHPTVLSSSQNHAMPVKHNVFLWNLPDVEEMPSHNGETVQFSSGLDEKRKKEDVPLRTAYSQAGRLWHPRNPVVLIILPRSLRAQAQLSETVTETFELVKVEQKLEDLREREKSEQRKTEQNILVPIFEEEIPTLFGKDIDKIELHMDKASSHKFKSTAAYFAKKNQKQE
ncbi:phosphatase and actin regulator 2 [Trichonephila clavipes]|nr:phosphatase and actin regulator 2 [Trichonephila clavipes]